MPLPTNLFVSRTPPQEVRRTSCWASSSNSVDSCWCCLSNIVGFILCFHIFPIKYKKNIPSTGSAITRKKRHNWYWGQTSMQTTRFTLRYYGTIQLTPHCCVSVAYYIKHYAYVTWCGSETISKRKNLPKTFEKRGLTTVRIRKWIASSLKDFLLNTMYTRIDNILREMRWKSESYLTWIRLTPRKLYIFKMLMYSLT